MAVRQRPGIPQTYAPDMLADPAMRAISRAFPALCAASLALPFAIGWVDRGRAGRAAGSAVGRPGAHFPGCSTSPGASTLYATCSAAGPSRRGGTTARPTCGRWHYFRSEKAGITPITPTRRAHGTAWTAASSICPLALSACSSSPAGQPASAGPTPPASAAAAADLRPAPPQAVRPEPVRHLPSARNDGEGCCRPQGVRASRGAVCPALSSTPQRTIVGRPRRAAARPE